MDWRDSEASEDDASLHDDPRLMLRKRSSRGIYHHHIFVQPSVLDHSTQLAINVGKQRANIKCERGSGDKLQCKSCALAGTGLRRIF